MVDRIKAAVDARVDENFVIMARTDALAVEGLDAAIERAQALIEAFLLFTAKNLNCAILLPSCPQNFFDSCYAT